MFRIDKFLISFTILAIALSLIVQIAAKEPESKLFDTGKLIEDVRVLSADDGESRSLKRPSISKAREYIKKRFTDAGLKPTEQEFDIRIRGQETPAKGINYIATIARKKKAAKHIVITAHYDHLGLHNGEVFNGSDDNASVTAALFAIAAYFTKHQPKHPLIVRDALSNET